ncbi:unnamed protein product [Parnassius apollo]|uniref:(apollo) hypothetical protein n=1 Tax=Parnassius apollo TaxID=110799 RepID=A0A8S3XI36_PARAO|nr:unnamed protein product [Parnassius apollo]
MNSPPSRISLLTCLCLSRVNKDSKLSKILDYIGNIKQQNDDIRESITFMSEKYDTLLSSVQSLQVENKAYRKRIEMLEEKIEGLKRSSHASRVELRNVPKKDRETKEDLLNIFVKTGEMLGLTLQHSDVRDIFRINQKNDSNKIIVAEFTSNITKQRFIANLKEYNRRDKNKIFTSTHAAIMGLPTPIFISENLSQKTRRLFAVAKNFRKENNYAYCWTSAGSIFLKKTDRDRPILIKSQEDISKIPMI